MWWIEEQIEDKTFNWHDQWGRIGQKGVNKDVQKGLFMGPTSPPNCHVACPHATTSIILNPNLALSSVHGEKRSCRVTQTFLLFL